jgi:epoxyqueuosine reductase
MEELERALEKADVDLVGTASVAEMEPRLRDQVVALLPEAKSAVVLAMEIFPEVLDHSRPEKLMGEGSPRDILVPHMDYLNSRITKAAYDLAKVSRRLGFKALPMAPANYPQDQRYLSALLSYKHAAEAAGLGTIGRHSLLVTPQFGPRVRLGCLLTGADLKPSPRIKDGLCEECNNCIAVCPSKALSLPSGDEPYAINKYACSVYRGAAGPCSECMRICPQGR